MPDGPVADVISRGRDPDGGRSVPWRWLAGATVAVLIAGVAAGHLIQESSSRPPHHQAPGSVPPAALAAPSMLHGTPWRPGVAPSTFLFLGGGGLRLLHLEDPAQASLTDVSPGAERAGNPLGPGAAVQQITSAAGGVFALISSHGPAGLRDIGDVLFIPVGAAGAGAPRIIARANYMALAPDHRSIWVEQAGPPWGNGPTGSPGTTPSICLTPPKWLKTIAERVSVRSRPEGIESCRARKPPGPDASMRKLARNSNGVPFRLPVSRTESDAISALVRSTRSR